MKLRIPWNVLAALVLWMSAASLLPGCISLKKGYPEIKTYGWDAEKAGHVSFSGKPQPMLLNAFTARPEFMDLYFLYRSGETHYESDFYNQFLTAPVYLVQGAARDFLKESPLASTLAGPGMTALSVYAIDAKMLEIYGDYRMESDPKAVLEMEWTVRDLELRDTPIVMQKTYSRAIPMEALSPEHLARGWRRGLGEILEAFEKDLKDLIVKGQ